MKYNSINRIDSIMTALSSLHKGYITYTYDGAGNVLRKQVYSDSVHLQSTTDYIGGMVYADSTLSYFPMPEGRVVNNAGTLTPEYVISDQQGNARFSFEDDGTGKVKIRQENSYYGFGESLVTSTVPVPPLANNNLYNGGAERQNEFQNLPDYDQTFYRHYDPALGRFIGVDPMPESAGSMTNYNYSGNNPVMFNDPLGNNKLPMPSNYSVTNSGGGLQYADWHLLAGLAYDGWLNAPGGIEYGGGGYGQGGLSSTNGAYDYGALEGRLGFSRDLASQDPATAAAAQASQEAARDAATQNGNATSSGVTAMINSIAQLFSDKDDLDIAYKNGKLIVSYKSTTDEESFKTNDDGSVINMYTTPVVAQRRLFDLNNIWNSPLARSIVPDDITLSINGNLVGAIGGGGSYNITLLTRGKDKGFHFNRNWSGRVGAEIGGGINISDGWFIGNPDDATYNSLLGAGEDVSGQFAFSGGLWTSFTNTRFNWAGGSVGFGPGVGGSGGFSTTTDGWW